jgi:23S rRNA pseudouridine2605 synthase
MKKKSGFEKFFKDTEKTGAAKKEQLRQDKRKFKKELNEKIQEKKRRTFGNQSTGNNQPEGGFPRGMFDDKPKARAEKPAFRKEGPSTGRPAFRKDGPPTGRNEGRPPARGNQSGPRKDSRPPARSNDRPAPKREQFTPIKKNDRTTDRKPAPAPERRTSSTAPRKEFIPVKKTASSSSPRPAERSVERRDDARPAPKRAAPEKSYDKKPASKFIPVLKGKEDSRPAARATASADQAPPAKSIKPKAPAPAEASMPLNKYIAHAGLCSRRDAVGW